MEIWLERSWFLVMMETTTPWQMAPSKKQAGQGKEQQSIPAQGDGKEELAHGHGKGEVDHADERSTG